MYLGLNMNFDHYVNYIKNKYRLATAIAVVKSKPHNISVEECITRLKNNLLRKNMDTDLNVSVTSTDFEFDVENHDDTFVTSFSQNSDVDNQVSDVTNTINEEICFSNIINNEDIRYTNKSLTQNDSQITHFEASQENIAHNITIENVIVPKNIISDENIYTNSKNYIQSNDLAETEIYTAPEFTQSCSHYSQSQCDNIIIPQKYIINNEQTIINTVEDNTLNKYPQNVKNKDLYFDQTFNIISQENLIQIPENIIFVSVDNSTGDNNLNTNDGENNLTVFNMNDQENHNTNDRVSDNNCVKNDTNDKENHFSISNDKEQDKHVTDVNIEELMDVQEEIIPFKVMRELNKAKIYLKRADDLKFDSQRESGYKSQGSQGSFKNVISIHSLNQSGHCLSEYLISYPLIYATKDITEEISDVLGSLIDRLHEEELYPAFLEKVLQNIDLLLRQIFEGDSSCDNALLIKEEQIQRIFLINISKNIQKYTLTVIIKYLENIIEKIQEESFEIKCINDLENLCYILHILELILIKYTKNTTLPTLVQSQDDKLNKSSLSELWRRKWNPNYKEITIEGSKEKCVLVHCSEVLNKLVVNCMEDYSLVSYSALKCFNLLQNV